MRDIRRAPFILLLAAAVLVPAASGQNPVSPKPRVQIAFDRYHDYAELLSAVRLIAEAHPQLVTLQTIGKSFEGRDLVVATVASRTGTPLARRPAMWIDANVHGNEVQGATATWQRWP